MNDVFFNAWMYHYWFLQMFTSQFLHGWITHLAMNAIFILYFWNVLEWIIWKNKMLLFFVSSSIFLWVFLTLLNTWNTVGISWFALAVLTYYTLLLWERWSPEYTGWLTAIVVNIVIWLSPWISFFWHFWGMIFWAIWWYMHRNHKNKWYKNEL
jgi:membrane associated rhomboid family serine protease